MGLNARLPHLFEVANPAWLSPDDTECDYELWRGVVSDLQGQGRKTTGVVVRPALQARDGGFDLSRHGVGFKQFVERAARAQNVRIAGQLGMDLLIDPVG